jgi:hypothetical protein
LARNGDISKSATDFWVRASGEKIKMIVILFLNVVGADEYAPTLMIILFTNASAIESLKYRENT